MKVRKKRMRLSSRSLNVSSSDGIAVASSVPIAEWDDVTEDLPPPVPAPDLNITGAMGFYAIAPCTPAGEQWVNTHLGGDDPDVVRLDGNAVVCEGGDRCRAIVTGAVKDSLRVYVNGVDMAPQKDGS